MKSHFILLGWLVCWAGQTWAREPVAIPVADTLIECGTEKVAVIRDTVSKDGRYALGWTLRPKAGNGTVDWSFYDPVRPSAILEKLPFGSSFVGDDKPGYLLFTGVLDVKKKTFVPLVTPDPNFPYGRYGPTFSVGWSRMGNNHPYAIISQTPKWYTTGFWLVQARADGLHITDLKADVDKALEKYVRKLDPVRSQDYELAYSTNLGQNRGFPLRSAFGKNSVTIPFDAEFSHGRRSCRGVTTLKLPEGSILRFTPERGRPPLVIEES